MITSLRGEVLYVDATTAAIEVGGVGMTFSATPATLAELRVGHEGRVFTSLVVREDSLTLFGFADDDERVTFDILQGVSGIGPRTALAVLSNLTPNMLRDAVAREDHNTLMRVPGIGKKGAQRMVIEIGTKLGAPTGPVAAPKAGNPTEADVVEGLVGLGWQEREAVAAYEEAVESLPDGTLAQLLRASLQILGSRR